MKKSTKTTKPKKTSSSKPSKKAVSKNTQNEEVVDFKKLDQSMTNMQQIEVHQHNIELLNRLRNKMVSSVMIDAKDSVIIATSARIMIIDAKTFQLAMEMNRLSMLSEEKQ